mmetsp:Transcript_864/g.3603  ORF Transcript_864/g.3603 Transcript_864/m.3603 type:complete len:365 (-) Transcript_864:89-1183(-)
MELRHRILAQRSDVAARHDRIVHARMACELPSIHGFSGAWRPMQQQVTKRRAVRLGVPRGLRDAVQALRRLLLQNDPFHCALPIGADHQGFSEGFDRVQEVYPARLPDETWLPQPGLDEASRDPSRPPRSIDAEGDGHGRSNSCRHLLAVVQKLADAAADRLPRKLDAFQSRLPVLFGAGLKLLDPQVEVLAFLLYPALRLRLDSRHFRLLSQLRFVLQSLPPDGLLPFQCLFLLRPFLLREIPLRLQDLNLAAPLQLVSVVLSLFLLLGGRLDRTARFLGLALHPLNSHLLLLQLVLPHVFLHVDLLGLFLLHGHVEGLFGELAVLQLSRRFGRPFQASGVETTAFVRAPAAVAAVAALLHVV